MAAQALRLNTVASNLANVNTVSSTAEGVYQPKQAVFEVVQLAERSGEPMVYGIALGEAISPPCRAMRRTIPGERRGLHL